MKKRIAEAALFAVLLAVCLSASGIVDGRTTAFSDLSQEDWYYPYVQDLYQLGVFSDGGGVFDGEGGVTWREAFRYLLLASGRDVTGLDTPEEWVQAAKENRLVYSFNEDFLDELTTRRSVARMAARAFGLTGVARSTPYADCDDGYVTQLYQKGLLSGERDEDGALFFRPEEPMTRAELAVFLWHAVCDDFRSGMFRYSNYWIDELEGVPLSPFTPGQFTREEDGRVSYTGGECALGVDVSGFQGEIDWEAVAADGVDFALVRMGGRFIQSGGLYDDSYFQRNLEGARAAGLDVGVYFFSQAITEEEAEEEAAYVLERLQGCELSYPVVFDWEYLMGGEGRTYGVDPEIITRCAQVFCERIAQAGYTPMIYFNAYCGYIKMDLSDLTRYPFWYAEYGDAPNFRYGFQMWQFTESGRVDGIDAPVDMDLCFVSGFDPGAWDVGAGREWPSVMI